ncbi:hypothetical protein NHJ6243_008874 [Beauveria neobassiana]
MQPSLVMALMAAGTLTGLAAGTSHQGRPKGWCEKADCSKVPAPYSRRGIVSLRDDRCQYSCHLRRLRKAAEKSAREKPVDLGIVPSVDEIIAPEPDETETEPSEDAKKKHAAEDVNMPDALQGGSAAAASIFASSPGLFKRAGEAAPQAPTGQFDVAVTNIPRRSEGPCKFSVDASAQPEQSGADIVCLGANGQRMMRSMTRAAVAMFAARLAAEYDRSCELTADTKAYFEGEEDKPVSPFDPSSTAEASAVVQKDTKQLFFLSCGAVFFNRPVAGSSGDAAAPAVRMLRDARGFVPLMAEGVPSTVFSTKQAGKTYDAASPPPWLEEVQAEVKTASGA